jgi:hypothetical protein
MVADERREQSARRGRERGHADGRGLARRGRDRFEAFEPVQQV